MRKAKSNKFRAGQQVALYSDRKGLRYGYQYVDNTKYYYIVVDLETLEEKRVLVNKVLAMSEAKKKLREIDKHNAKAA